MPPKTNFKGGKLVLKGGITLTKEIDKKKKKKVRKVEEQTVEEQAAGTSEDAKAGFNIDDGTGFAPDGKKSKKYEELFPVETRKFGFKEPQKVQTREEALLERVKKKADRYCK